MKNIMTKEEEGEYKSRILADERHALDDFYLKNYPLILWVVKKYRQDNKKTNDEIRFVAENKFLDIASKPEKWNGRFSTFAVTCMKNAIIDYLRKANRTKTYSPPEWFWDDVYTSDDYKDDDWIDSDIQTDDFSIICSLSEGDRNIYEMRYTKEMKISEIAKELSITKRGVLKSLQRLKTHIRHPSRSDLLHTYDLSE